MVSDETKTKKGMSGTVKGYLILIGLVYIVETLSVILQVAYFKLTHGKRIFKMAPIHHHFEMSGWKEEKIVLVFTAVSVIMCILAWIGIS
jgi:phospho-N-acetylmuramoyl-pentapeptide-transferase